MAIFLSNGFRVMANDKIKLNFANYDIEGEVVDTGEGGFEYGSPEYMVLAPYYLDVPFENRFEDESEIDSYFMIIKTNADKFVFTELPFNTDIIVQGRTDATEAKMQVTITAIIGSKTGGQYYLVGVSPLKK